jgi:hypothetical protein
MEVQQGIELVSTAENKRDGNLAGGSEPGAGSSDEALERKIFGLALAIATEPSKLDKCGRCWCSSRSNEVSLKLSQPGLLDTSTNE